MPIGLFSKSQNASFREGFTLIELIIVMAIIALLAGIVLVSMSGYAKDARASKALSEISSAIPSMMSCWTNGGQLNTPSGSGTTPICQLSSSYGYWPATAGDLSSYSYMSDWDNPQDKNSWTVILINQAADGKLICCNGTMKNCRINNYTSSGWEFVCDRTHPAI